MFKEFQTFIMRGNVVDMAVGIIIGAAFSTIVKSLVDDVIMPPVGLLLGGVDFSNLFSVIKEGTTAAPYATLELAKEAGAVTVNWGLFFNNILSFIIVAIAVFCVVKSLNRLHERVKKQEQEQAEEAPPMEQQLLAEIRDLLKQK